MPCPKCGNLVAYSTGSCLRCSEDSNGEKASEEHREQSPTLYRIAIFLCAFAAFVLLVVLL
jgi:hypothetical protein